MKISKKAKELRDDENDRASTYLQNTYKNSYQFVPPGKSYFSSFIVPLLFIVFFSALSVEEKALLKQRIQEGKVVDISKFSYSGNIQNSDSSSNEAKVGDENRSCCSDKEK